MTTDELNQLRDLAQAATPGPWRVEAQGHAPQQVARANNLEVAPPDHVELAHCATDAAYIAAVSPDVVLGLIDEVLTSRRRIGALTTLTDAQTARLQSYMNDGAKRAEAINTLASEREANALLTDEIERLRAILDRRPALNDGLREAYAEWSGEVYAMDARAAVGEEGEHCMRTSSDPDTRRRVPSGAEMRAVADALGNLGTKTRGR